MVDKERVSGTGVTRVPPIALYSNSPEASDLADDYVKIIPGNIISAFMPSEDLGDGGDGEDGGDNPEDPGTGKKAPDLSDIQLISNTVVYDATGKPSVTVVFKVKNSSGKTLKGVNPKVQLL